MLSRTQRLSSDQDIRTVLKKGAFVFSKHIKVVWVQHAQHKNVSRWAVVVSTKVDKRATVRNRIRRVLQSVVSNSQHMMRGCDVVVVVRPSAAHLDTAGLRSELEALLKKAVSR